MIASLSPVPVPVKRLPRLEHVPRKGVVLHPSPFADQPDVLSLNLGRGCVQRCPFCSVRANAGYPGDDVLYLYEGTAAKLDAELKVRRPKAVFVCPSTDPFPPLGAVQHEAARVVAALAAHGVEAWLMTRGYIRPAIQELLAHQAGKVKVTVAFTTLDRGLQRVLEPLAAPPRLRLRQIKQLRARGIAVQAALEPLLPGLTDTRENLDELLEALAGVGVRQVTASYSFLRESMREELVHALEPLGWDQAVLAAFQGGPVLAAGNIAPARYLPKARRQRGYSALMALAANHGMSVRVNAATNPDFAPGRAAEVARPRQQLLPMMG